MYEWDIWMLTWYELGNNPFLTLNQVTWIIMLTQLVVIPENNVDLITYNSSSIIFKWLLVKKISPTNYSPLSIWWNKPLGQI